MSKEYESFDTDFVGRKFPCFTYTITEDRIRKYLAAVQDKNTFYEENKVVPPALAAVYTRWPMISGLLGLPGTIHVKQQYKYYKPIPWGATLKIYGEIVDKYIKKDHKYVIQEVKVYDEAGDLVTISRASIILPK